MPELQTSSPETVEERKATEPKPEKSQVEKLAELFADESPAPQERREPERAEGKAGESQEKAKPLKALKDLAERLELAPEALYAIEVPMSDGKTMSLGQLKDAAAKQGDFTVRELAFEEQRTRQEGELLRAQGELRELIAALPQSAIKPETLELIRQKHEANLKRERTKTLEVIPEWSDETKRTEEIGGIVEHLKDYGFPANYLQSVYDHRTLKYIRDNYLREQRIRKALEQVQATSPLSTPKSKTNGAAPKKPHSAPLKERSDSRSRLLNLLSD